MRLAFTTLLLFPLAIKAQISHPAISNISGYGGDQISLVTSFKAATRDNGFIVSINSDATAGTGNIDSFCDVGGSRSIFLKFNGDASTLEWAKCYIQSGDTMFESIFPQADGGFVFGGTYNSSSGWGIYICKEDALGNIVWSHGYSKGNNLEYSCMVPTDDGGFVIGGGSFYTDSNVAIHYGSWMNSDIFLMKIDSSGNKVWTRVIGGSDDDLLWALIPDANYNFYALGGTYSNDFDCVGNHGQIDVYVVRLDKNGNILWHKDIGGTRAENAFSGAADGKGGVIIAAATNSMDGDVSHPIDSSGNVWLIDLDSNGVIAWDNCYGGIQDSFIVECQPQSICKAIDGSIWAAGFERGKKGEIDTSYGRDDAWFVHADSVGNFIGAKVLGGSGTDRAYLVCPLSDGSVMGGGLYDKTDWSFCTSPFSGLQGAFFVRFTPWTDEIEHLVSEEEGIIIYPNPSSSHVTISCNGRAPNNVIILNILGDVMYRTTFNKSIELALDSWPRGLYFVQIVSENNTRVKKMVVN